MNVNRISDDIPEQIHSLTVKLSGRNGESGTGVVVKGDEAKNHKQNLLSQMILG